MLGQVEDRCGLTVTVAALLLLVVLTGCVVRDQAAVDEEQILHLIEFSKETVSLDVSDPQGNPLIARVSSGGLAASDLIAADSRLHPDRPSVDELGPVDETDALGAIRVRGELTCRVHFVEYRTVGDVVVVSVIPSCGDVAA